jgi:hypothetical protein
MSTHQTLGHHLQAFGEGIDSLMKDYVEESVLFTPDGPLTGLASIRIFFNDFLTKSPPGLLQALTVTRQDVHGEFAYLHWKAAPFISFASDTFVVRDNKIVLQSVAFFDGD